MTLPGHEPAWQHSGWETLNPASSHFEGPSTSSSNTRFKPASDWAPPQPGRYRSTIPEPQETSAVQKAGPSRSLHVVVISDDEAKPRYRLSSDSGPSDKPSKRIKLDESRPSSRLNATDTVPPHDAIDFGDLPCSQTSSASSSSHRLEACSPNRTPRAQRHRTALVCTPKVDRKGKGKAKATDVPPHRDLAQSPRFLPNEVPHLSTYLLRPSSVVHTTCASLALYSAVFDHLLSPGSEDDGEGWMFPTAKEEGLRWRLRTERVSMAADEASENSNSVEVLMQGNGWPVRSVKVVGWLVGVAARMNEQGNGGRVDMLGMRSRLRVLETC